MVILTAFVLAYAVQYFFQYRALYFNENHGKKPFYISTSILILGLIFEIAKYVLTR